MKNRFVIISALCLTAVAGCCRETALREEPSLKEALKDKFYFGAALNVDQIFELDAREDAIIKHHFNAIVAENCMKSMFLQPREGEFFFDEADRFVEFGERNGMWITGHTLVWHSQAPGWLFVDAEGNDVSREVMIERMRNHIHTVVGRYKGRVKGWDVVNEAILDDGSWRASKFYNIIGEDFIRLAFQFAHEADPDAELYYNDFNEWQPAKRAAIINLVKGLKEAGVRVDAVGLQAHFGWDYPTLDEYRATIDDYAAAGIKLMITELDLSVLPRPDRTTGANVADTVAYRNEMNPYTAGLPEGVSAEWDARMGGFFRLFIDNSDKIQRVTTWGVTDAASWKNDFPMPGRTDYPLLFDRENRAKPVVRDIIEMTENK